MNSTYLNHDYYDVEKSKNLKLLKNFGDEEYERILQIFTTLEQIKDKNINYYVSLIQRATNQNVMIEQITERYLILLPIMVYDKLENLLIEEENIISQLLCDNDSNILNNESNKSSHDFYSLERENNSLTLSLISDDENDRITKILQTLQSIKNKNPKYFVSLVQDATNQNVSYQQITKKYLQSLPLNVYKKIDETLKSIVSDNDELEIKSIHNLINTINQTYFHDIFQEIIKSTGKKDLTVINKDVNNTITFLNQIDNELILQLNKGLTYDQIIKTVKFPNITSSNLITNGLRILFSNMCKRYRYSKILNNINELNSMQNGKPFIKSGNDLIKREQLLNYRVIQKFDCIIGTAKWSDSNIYVNTIVDSQGVFENNVLNEDNVKKIFNELPLYSIANKQEKEKIDLIQVEILKLINYIVNIKVPLVGFDKDDDTINNQINTNLQVDISSSEKVFNEGIVAVNKRNAFNTGLPQAKTKNELNIDHAESIENI